MSLASIAQSCLKKKVGLQLLLDHFRNGSHRRVVDDLENDFLLRDAHGISVVAGRLHE
jgi:hypothetical protein